MMIKSFTKIRKLSIFMAVIMCLSAFFVGIPQTAQVNAAEKKTEEELEAEIEQYKAEQESLQAKIDAADDSIEAAQEKKSYLDQLITAATEEISATEELISEYTAKIEAKEAEIAQKENEISEKFDQMMVRLRYSYEEGDASYLELIFDAKDMSTFLSNVDNVSAMMDFDQSLMEEITEQLTALQNEKIALSNILSEQEQLEDELETKKENLKGQKEESDALIQQLKSDQEVYAAELKKAKAAEEASQEELDKLIRSSNAQAWGGAYIWPVPKGYTRISSGYGWRVLWGYSDFHRGIDIPVPTGTEIYASAGGTVVTATYHYSWGNYVLINHGNGYLTLYAHNSSLCVRAGDVVDQGDVIAYAGSTGSSSGSHCHFEVLNGSISNTCSPLNFVSVP